MRNLLALIGLAVVAFAGIGWYCGWYKFTVTKTSDGKPEIKTTVNPDKVADDSTSFFKRLEQLVTDKANQDQQKNIQPRTAPVETPGPIAPVKGGTPNRPPAPGGTR